AFDPANACCDRKRGVIVLGGNLWIGTLREQELHEFHIARLRGAQERCGVAFAFLGRRLHAANAAVDVRALGDQQFDEVEVIHVGLADRVVAGFYVAIVGGEIERIPAALVGQIRIGAVVEQPRSHFVVAILRCCQERAPAIIRGLIDICTGIDEILSALHAAFTCGEHEGCEAAAIAWGRPAEKRKVVGCGGFFVEGRKRSSIGSVSCGGCSATTGTASSTTSCCAATATATGTGYGSGSAFTTSTRCTNRWCGTGRQGSISAGGSTARALRRVQASLNGWCKVQARIAGIGIGNGFEVCPVGSE